MRRWIGLAVAALLIGAGVWWSMAADQRRDEGGAAGEPVVLMEREPPEGWRWREERLPEDGFFGLLRGKEDWEAFASAHPQAAGRLAEPDWRREALVVAYLGTAPTGGYAVRIERVLRQPETLRVDLALRSPAPGEFVTLAMTHPIDSVSVPKGELPPAALASPAATRFFAPGGLNWEGAFPGRETE